MSTEILKKTRVLGLKDKEISRITSKLKTCEEHISKLHKIQSKNRGNKLVNASSPIKFQGITRQIKLFAYFFSLCCLMNCI
jgi:hypothetical protein